MEVKYSVVGTAVVLLSYSAIRDLLILIVIIVLGVLVLVPVVIRCCSSSCDASCLFVLFVQVIPLDPLVLPLDICSILTLNLPQ